MALDQYRRKRDFARTPEPAGRGRTAAGEARRFVVQKHAARRLHYDFRLELNGVLKSWAVPKGPSLDPGDRRLAVHVEDHPIEYQHFEGIIPKGEYGGGTVMVWDQGTWYPEGDPEDGYRRGRLRFRLRGRKLQGRWSLVRTGGRAGDDGADNWLLIKGDDKFGSTRDLLDEQPRSVLSGRDLDEIAAAADRVWHSARGEPAPPVQDGAAALPGKLTVQLATLVEAAPDGDDWLHEIKYDGYRILARIEGGRARLLSRSGKDWTHRFPRIHEALLALGIEQTWLDGEVASLLPDGRSSFEALQQALSDGDDAGLVYLGFDLLFHAGRDLRALPLLERKARLAELLAADAAPPLLRYSDHVVGHGMEFYRQACGLGLEGIISKRTDRPHFSGRNRDWVKVKCLQRQEFVVVGFTEPSGSRRGFGALLLGVHDEAGRLVYAGRVGTGFDQRQLRELGARLEALRVPQPPVAEDSLPTENLQRAHWVRPVLVAEVAFANWTREGVLRHASFVGLREDKAVREVVRERPQAEPAEPPVPARRDASPPLRLSNPDKVLYPGQGLTKRDLAEYYLRVAELMLPEIARRPLTLLRCPHGRHQACFYQKHADDSASAAILRVPIPEKGKSADYMAVDSLEGLLALVQIGVLEIHVWGARMDRLDRPDRVVFDLDPDESLPWEAVPRAAARLRTHLTELGLRAFLRTTGGKGLHLVLPLERRHGWDEVKAFSKAVALHMVRAYPGEYTATLSKRARRGKLFIDYLRNGQGATAIANYSTRARPGATVAVPLNWDELDAVRPDAFTVANLPARLDGLTRDPWDGFARLRQSLTKPIRTALGLA